MTETVRFFAKVSQACISTKASLREAMQVLASAGSLIVCFTDQDFKLAGILTDSDIRKSLLNGARLDDLGMRWSNKSPQVAGDSSSAQELQQLAVDSGKREIPLLDEQGRLVDIFVLGLFDVRASKTGRDTPRPKGRSLPNAAFILAGGKGTRLRPVVSDRPKPLAVVGGKPILETLMDQLISCGIRRYYISVNYMADQIEQHLKLEKYRNFDIHFVREPEPLGTGGSIGYVKDELDEPLLVCNADVLSALPFGTVIQHHIAQSADITCIVRPHRITIPYGVFEVTDQQILSVAEKPELTYLINAGIYVLSAEVCREFPVGVYLDMPDVVKTAIQRGRKVSPFLLHEYWMDVGRPEDYRRANEEYGRVFEGEI